MPHVMRSGHRLQVTHNLAVTATMQSGRKSAFLNVYKGNKANIFYTVCGGFIQNRSGCLLDD